MLRRIFFILFPLTLFSLHYDPWFGQTWLFYLTPSYTYDHYPDVDNGTRKYSSDDNLIKGNLNFSFLPQWDIQFEGIFASTQKLSWGMQAIGTSLRYLQCNDVEGDPVSLTFNGSLFYVPVRSQKDPSTPFHATLNLELGAALGKEIDKIYNWRYRFWGYGGIGVANRGAPWARGILALDARIYTQHLFRLFGHGYFGMGGVEEVNIDRLRGYANIAHQSVDLGLRYAYEFEIWGNFSVEYFYRVFAHSFPECMHSITVAYTLPFSLF
ncbi:MAG: hypothetical protein SNF33_07045 [Candidatus Algichlamydia australiensis]|nr:hypothetical protein [Chlamydiales bacterium]